MEISLWGKEENSQSLGETVWLKFHVHVPSLSSDFSWIQVKWSSSSIIFFFQEWITWNGWLGFSEVLYTSSECVRIVLHFQVFPLHCLAFLRWDYTQSSTNSWVKILPIAFIAQWKIGNLRKLWGEKYKFKLSPVTRLWLLYKTKI